MFRAVPPLLLSSLALLLTAPRAAGQGHGETPSPVPPAFVEMDAGAPDFVHSTGSAGEFHLPEIMCGGAALLDHDGDGDLDLYLVQGQRLEGETDPALGDRLYRNQLAETGTLAFTDATAAAKLGDPGYGCGVTAGDYDGDGHVDLYVTRLGADLLLRNQGDGTFSDATATAGLADGPPRWGTSAAFVDHDGDGDLDLFVANYVEFTPDQSKQCRTAAGARDYCNPSAFRGLPDRLFANRGDGTFAEISRRGAAAAGIGDVRSKSLGVLAADLNGDGRTDYYVTNDGVPNQLWQQDGEGSFQDVALLAGVAVNGDGKAEASMGVDAADDDADGDLDLVLTHLRGETDTLYRHDGGGFFEDATRLSGLGAPSWPFTSWGTAWDDLDLDGDLDLVTSSGVVRALEELVDAGDPFPFHQPNQLFVNVLADGGGARYVDAGAAAGEAFARSEVSRGIASGDLDGDGDLDLVVVNADGPVRVLLNQTRQRHPERRWLGARLVVPGREGAPPRDALGAVVELEGAVPRQVRRAHADGSYASSNDPRVIFALGPAQSAGAAREGGAKQGGTGSAGDGATAPPPAWTLSVTWPDGLRERFAGLAAGRYHTLVRGTGKAAGAPGVEGREDAGSAPTDASGATQTPNSTTEDLP